MMGIVCWCGFRQVQALRDGLTWTLGGKVPGTDEQTALMKWLREQGCEITPGSCPTNNAVTLIDLAIETRRSFLLRGDRQRIEQQAARASYGELKDVGVLRSSAGWDRAGNFCITSAFVRLLGALEQFELDALKALLYYRPGGRLGPVAEAEQTPVEEHVLWEVPNE